MSETPIKKQALLIGINEYQFLPQLKYARQDAEAVAESLKQNYCFSDNEVMVLTDVRPGLFRPTDRYIIQDHLERLANQELDLFIFGFWGHGLFRKGQRYLCPLNVKSARAEHQGLPFELLQDLLARIKAKNTCMILDCCPEVLDRGEEETLTAAEQTVMENAARDIVLRREEETLTAAEQTVMENAARDIVLRRKEIEPEFQSNVAILNSCIQGQSAYEWDCRKHGIFTAHLLDAMNRRYDSVAQIVRYISKNVEKTSMELGKTQTPFFRLDGDILLPVDTKSASLVTKDVFISYLHRNIDLVAPVKEELKKRGVSYFIDSVGINYGMNYSDAIVKAISSCKLVLLLWTSDVNDSADIAQEVIFAQNCKKPFVVYKVGDFNPTKNMGLFYHLVRFSWYEVSQQTPETVVDLVDRIEQSLSSLSHPRYESPDAISSLSMLSSKNSVLQPKRSVDNDAVVSQPKPKAPVSGDVFVSYRSHNLAKVEPILKELSKRGISYYIDKEKLRSGDYNRKIAVAIDACKILFLYWTEDVDESKYIPNEIHLAFDNGKEIIPYKIGNFDINKQFNVIFDLNRKHILEDSQATIIDVVDSIQQALTELKSRQTPKQNSEQVVATPVHNHQKSIETPDNSDISDFIQKKIKQLKSEAFEAIENEDYKKAIKKLSGLLNLDPNAKDAERLLSFCKLALENDNNQE